MKFQSKYARQKKSPMISQPSFRDRTRRQKIQMKGVATIQDLKQEVATFKSTANTVNLELLSTNTINWNGMFHDISST